MIRPCALALLVAGASFGCTAADRSAQTGGRSDAATAAALTADLSAAGAGNTAGAAGGATAPSTARPPSDSLTDAADRGRILGSPDAPIWLLVVSDFQCPWCKQWHDSTFPAIRRRYVDAGKVRVAYLNLPLSMHANAVPAAMAAMCASAQGKFWATHDRIFETQKRWEGLADPSGFLDSVAVAAGAVGESLRACTSGRRLAALIEADEARAHRAGAESTPIFFVGGRKIEGAQPLREFSRVIDSVLAAANKK